MQLKITTDYAIRTLLYLAQTGKVTSSAEVSEKMSIPRKYLINIAKSMRDAGLIDTHSGTYGGYTLAKPAEEITMLDVINAMEGTIRINRCLEDDEYCNRFASADCPVRGFYLGLQQDIEASLQKRTIGMLAAGLKKHE